MLANYCPTACSRCSDNNVWTLRMVATNNQVLWEPKCRIVNRALVIIDNGWKVEEK